MRMIITTATLPPTIFPTNGPGGVGLLGVPCESDLLEGTPTFVLAVKTDVTARVEAFALVCTCEVESIAVSLLDRFSSDVVVGSLEA